MKLEITADKVKEAAAKCPQAEATLKTLFPEVFDDDFSVDILSLANFLNSHLSYKFFKLFPGESAQEKAEFLYTYYLQKK